MRISKETIQNANAPVSFNVPSLGGEVLIRRLTVGEKMSWFDRVTKTPDLIATLVAEQIAMAVVNEDGTPMFTADEVLALDAVVIDEIYIEIKKRNRLDKKAVDEAEKK